MSKINKFKGFQIEGLEKVKGGLFDAECTITDAYSNPGSCNDDNVYDSDNF